MLVTYQVNMQLRRTRCSSDDVRLLGNGLPGRSEPHRVHGPAHGGRHRQVRTVLARRRTGNVRPRDRTSRRLATLRGLFAENVRHIGRGTPHAASDAVPGSIFIPSQSCLCTNTYPTQLDTDNQ